MFEQSPQERALFPRGTYKDIINSLCSMSQWYNLSNIGFEEALRVRLDFILFTGFEVETEVPDHSTLCRFRNILIDQGLNKVPFEEINEQLESMNIKVKQAECAILDATIIESSARPKKTLVVPEKARQETKHSSSHTLRKSVDPDAEWLIKGGKYYFGPVEKWEGSDKNLRNWLKIKWPIYIANH